MVMETDDLSSIMSPHPRQWGLRGDPLLWNYIEKEFEGRKLPYPVEHFEEEILQIFKRYVGEPLDENKEYFVENFYSDDGGMSSGWVHGPTWSEKLIPLLIRRLRIANNRVGEH